jgi:hypothetical protein
MYSSAPKLKRPNRKNAAAPAPRSPFLSQMVLIGAGMVFMLLLETLFWPGRGLAWKHLGTTLAKSDSARESTNAPWGQLEYTPIALDRPEEYFTNDLNHAAPKTLWFFRNQTEQQLSDVLNAFEFTDSARAWLTNRAHWQFTPRGIVIPPPAEVVVSLSPETRQKFYKLLAQNPENALQVTPFRFRADGFDDWFANCGVSPEKISLVRKLTYEQDGGLCFADAPTFAALSTPAETKSVIQCLWRVSTFVAKLRIGPHTDVNQLMQYWSPLGPAREYRPLIESMTRVPEGSTINLSYLLPPFARLRLYTYPNPRDQDIARQDCFWSSMNFFNQVPDNRFFNPEQTQKVLETEYTRVRDESRRFGDLLMLTSADNQALHMCVHIADDVVFTKNGANTQQPWVLMRWKEMLSQYEKNRPFQVRVFRRNSPPPLGAVQEVSSAARAL